MVKTVHDGDRAIEYLTSEASQIDLILNDIAMPGSHDGIALADWTANRYPRSGMVLMTGYSDRLDRALTQGRIVLANRCSPHALLDAWWRAVTRHRRRVAGPHRAESG
jgi:CheY-like chemotaxis protein